MWVRKSQSETNQSRQDKLLWATLVDVLLGAGIWYVLVEASAFFGLLPDGSISTWIGCGVMIVILPAAWYSEQRAHRENHRTVVCERCQVVKPDDGQRTCSCGGRYFALAEMEWTGPSHPPNQ